MLTLPSLAGSFHLWSVASPGARDTEHDTRRPNEEHTQNTPPDDQGRTTAEKITTAISIVIIALLAGAILYEGYAAGQNGPAVLEVTVLRDQIDQRDGSFYIPVEIHNAGNQTVEEVSVSIELRNGEQIVDEAEMVIASLAEEATQQAVLVVDEDPTGMTIDAGVVTFQIAED